MLGSLYVYPDPIGLDQSYQYFQNSMIWIVPMAKVETGSQMLWNLIEVHRIHFLVFEFFFLFNVIVFQEQYLLFATLFLLVPIIATIVNFTFGLQLNVSASKTTRFGIVNISVFMFRALIGKSILNVKTTKTVLFVHKMVTKSLYFIIFIL